MEVKSKVLTKIAEKMGAEVQRAAAVSDQMEAPWDVAEVPFTISMDERAMLCAAHDGVSWPAETAEAVTCEWLREHGLMKVSGKGDGRVWTLTRAGAKLAGHIHEKDEELRCSCRPEVLSAIPPVDLAQ